MARQNLSLNPAVGANLNDWFTNGSLSRLDVSAEPDFPRPWACRLQGGSYVQAGQSASIDPSKTYTASAYVRAANDIAASSASQLFIDWYNSSGGNVGSVSKQESYTADQVKRVSLTDTAVPNSAEFGRFTVENDGVTMDVTAVLFEQSDTLDTYADGETTGWQWNGARFNSTSSELTAVQRGATLASTSDLTAHPQTVTQAGVSLDATSSITAGFRTVTQAGAGLDSTSELSAAFRVVRRAKARLDATSGLTARGRVVTLARAVLDSTAGLTARGRTVSRAGAQLATTSGLTARAKTATRLGARLAATSDLTARARVVTRARAVLAATSGLVARFAPRSALAGIDLTGTVTVLNRHGGGVAAVARHDGTVAATGQHDGTIAAVQHGGTVDPAARHDGTTTASARHGGTVAADQLEGTVAS